MQYIAEGQAEQAELLDKLDAKAAEIDKESASLLKQLQGMKLPDTVDLDGMVTAGIASLVNERKEIQAELSGYTQACWQKAVGEILFNDIGIAMTGGGSSNTSFGWDNTHPVKRSEKDVERVYAKMPETPDRISLFAPTGEHVYTLTTDDTNALGITSRTKLQVFHTNLQLPKEELNGFEVNPDIGSVASRVKYFVANGWAKTNCDGDKGVAPHEKSKATVEPVAVTEWAKTVAEFKEEK
jgi:hypothetical protein